MLHVFVGIPTVIGVAPKESLYPCNFALCKRWRIIVIVFAAETPPMREMSQLQYDGIGTPLWVICTDHVNKDNCGVESILLAEESLSWGLKRMDLL